MQPNVVLLVEDNPDDVLLMQQAFRSVGPGYMLVHVAEATEAKAYLSGRGQYEDRMRFPFPALVLLDLVMPGESGFAVLEWIRSQAEISRVAVVVLSGTAHSEDVSRAYKMGADSFLEKPMERKKWIEDLKLALAHWAPLGQEPRESNVEQRGIEGH